MTTQITSFQTPEVTVQFSNIKLDHKKKTFSLTLGTKENGQRKFREEEVHGTLTSELYNYFTRMKAVKIPVQKGDKIEWVRTGDMATGFQKHLAKKNIPFAPGVLSTQVFKSENTSTSYSDNPFRLVMLGEKNILTLVNVPSKKATTTLNADGTTSTYYKVKRGMIDNKPVKAFIRPEKYRRLIRKVTEQVEVAAVEGFTPYVVNQ